MQGRAVLTKQLGPAPGEADTEGDRVKVGPWPRCWKAGLGNRAGPKAKRAPVRPILYLPKDTAAFPAGQDG